jgi:aminopeptidase YwaD
MFRIRGVLILVFLTTCLLTKAQKDYARKVVDTLASPYMAGRGYDFDGDKKAAKYIGDQMKEFGLLPFGSSYEQHFKFNVNTFPYKMEVSVNGKLQPIGADYIVIPNSCSEKGSFPVKRFTRSTLLDAAKMYEFKHQDHRKEFILLDDTGITDKAEKAKWEQLKYNPFKAKGIIVICNKLTQETSDSVADYVLINAMRNSIFDSTTTITVDIKNKFVKDYDSQNLIGYFKGNVQPDSFIVFSAHYDHLGKMGDAYFPGANDNASGTAMLLSLARYYSTHKESLKYSLVFIAFTGEEMGLYGSKYYTSHPLFPLTAIKFELNMDIMGTGDEGITVVNAPTYNAAFKDLQKINDSLHLLKLIKPRGPTSNSDHYFFYTNHVPDFFIYTMGGIKAYHDIYDRRETLPLTDFDNVFKLILQFTDDICNQRF